MLIALILTASPKAVISDEARMVNEITLTEYISGCSDQNNSQFPPFVEY
jgi:hypothetical protein